MEITRTLFETQQQRRFGTSNPERMPLAFWEWMVRTSEEARLRDWTEGEEVPGHTPYQLRVRFGQGGDYTVVERILPGRENCTRCVCRLTSTHVVGRTIPQSGRGTPAG
jgi:hypothetical protein